MFYEVPLWLTLPRIRSYNNTDRLLHIMLNVDIIIHILKILKKIPSQISFLTYRVLGIFLFEIIIESLLRSQ